MMNDGSLAGSEILEISEEDTEAVYGGLVPLAVAVPIAASAAVGYAADGWRGAAHGAVFAGATIATGGIAAATSGFVSLSWRFRQFGVIFAGGATTRASWLPN